MQGETTVATCQVATTIVDQLALGLSRGRWPRTPPVDHLRGIDFYSSSDVVYVLASSAELFRERHGYLPNLESPSSFNEHIFVRKFLAPLPMPSLADKLAGREFAKLHLGDELVKRIVWIGDDAAELFRLPLPPGRFVLKTNHGSGFNMILNLPDDLSARRTEIESLSTKWLGTPFGLGSGEWQYCTFRAKLFLEEFLEFDGSAAPDEYNLLCFHGHARLIVFHRDPFNTHRNSLYDLSWNQVPVLYGLPEADKPRPDNLREIIQAAETLAKHFEFVRVDLNSDGRRTIKFGELTFTPNNAMRRFSDFQFDLDLGKNFLC